MASPTIGVVTGMPADGAVGVALAAAVASFVINDTDPDIVNGELHIGTDPLFGLGSYTTHGTNEGYQVPGSTFTINVPINLKNRGTTYYWRVRANDGMNFTDTATFSFVTVYTVSLSAPTGITSTGGPNITTTWSATAPVSPQATYRVRFQNAAGSTTYYDSGVLSGTATSKVVDLVAAGVPTDTAGSALKVVVDLTTAGGASAQVTGLFDVQWGVITCAITAPLDEAIVSTTTITATWSFASTRGKTQAHYRVRLLSPDTGTVFYDSGWVASAVGTLAVPFTLNDGSRYRLGVQTKNSEGVLS